VGLRRRDGTRAGVSFFLVPMVTSKKKTISQAASAFGATVVAYMITRQASASHICLRCQRRLARRPSSYTYQLAFQSTNTGARVSTPPGPISPSEPSAKDKNPQPQQTLVPLNTYINPERIAQNPRPFKRYRVVQQPKTDFYGHSGQKLINEREQLQIDTLGKSTDVIVLRESKITRYDGGTHIQRRSQTAEHVDIMARLNKERGLMSQTEVEQNINEFRPKKDEEPKSRTEFNNLVDKMQAAFTSFQLEQYIGSFEGRRTLQPSTESSPAPLPSVTPSTPHPSNNVLVLEETPWIAETTDPTGYLEEKLSLRGYALASHTTKQRLVVQLLRECWMLELPDVLVSLGHIDLLLRPGDMELLSSGLSVLLSKQRANMFPRISRSGHG
jgi:hypothetical protein